MNVDSARPLSASKASRQGSETPGRIGSAKPRSANQSQAKPSVRGAPLIADPSIDTTKIPEYIVILQDHIKTCIEEGKFKEAELATQKIEELKGQELSARSIFLMQKHKEEADELERANLQHFNEFNLAWDQAIAELEENLRRIESDLSETHVKELQIFDEEVLKIEIPKAKHSREVLNLRVIFQKLLKAKQFGEAEDVKNQIEKLEREEEEKWVQTFREKFAKKKVQLEGKQRIELEALQVKLRNALNEKLKIREMELEKLLQRFQNLKSELENRQNLELSKLTVNSTKLLSRMAVSRQSVANINASIDNYIGSRFNAPDSIRSRDIGQQ